MTEYQVVREDGLNDLEVRVTTLIKEGWLPQGGVSISITDMGSCLATLAVQAMIRRKI